MGSVGQIIRYSFEEYLALEEQAEYRSEFRQGEIVTLEGELAEHSRIIQNVNRELGNAIFDRDCSVFGGDLKVRIEEADVSVYPDGQVICDPIAYFQDRRDVVTNPIVVVEVLSNSTALYDRTAKFRHYQQISSLMEYVLVEQQEAQVDVFRRNASGLWELQGYAGLDQEIKLKSLEVVISANRIYHRVGFKD